jgi:hypothetical protein
METLMKSVRVSLAAPARAFAELARASESLALTWMPGWLAGTVDLRAGFLGGGMIDLILKITALLQHNITTSS